jgi:hypothetical protein
MDLEEEISSTLRWSRLGCMIPTSEQIESLAPDGQVLAAGRKLAKPGQWQGLGRQGTVVWGECRGSAVYGVAVNLTGSGYRCSCPSRKHPCKHVIGLLTLVSGGAGLPESGPPEWVMQWLARREAAAGRKGAIEDGSARVARTQPDQSAQRRAETRRQRILEGLDVLERWMCDIVGNGMAGLELQPHAFWEQQAARLVDAQAPGLAGRVRRLAGIPRSGAGWPERLLGELGRLELLIHAFRRLDDLDPALQHDVRQLVGLPLSTEEVAAQGEHEVDDWTMLGQSVEADGNLRAQRTWLVGLSTHRTALVLQFAPGMQPFPPVASINAVQRMELHFWPGAYPLRARIDRRLGETYRLDERRPGHATIEEFLRFVAGALARNPWLDRFLAVLHDVVPLVGEGGDWSVRDTTGAGLPLAGRGYWKSLANSGGHPMDLYAEWDGYALRPLALRVLEDIPTGGAS